MFINLSFGNDSQKVRNVGAVRLIVVIPVVWSWTPGSQCPVSHALGLPQASLNAPFVGDDKETNTYMEVVKLNHTSVFEPAILLGHGERTCS